MSSHGFAGSEKIAANGYGFVQDGHSYSVAGLAGHRLGGFSLKSLRPNYWSSVRITNAQDIFCRPACIKLMLAAVALNIIELSIEQLGQEETILLSAKQFHNLLPYNHAQFDSWNLWFYANQSEDIYL